MPGATNQGSQMEQFLSNAIGASQNGEGRELQEKNQPASGREIFLIKRRISANFPHAFLGVQAELLPHGMKSPELTAGKQVDGEILQSSRVF